jgi:ATP synthase F subunit
MEGEIGLIAVIGEESLVSGFLLAGIGLAGPLSNFFVVDAATSKTETQLVFEEFLERTDLSVVLVSQFLLDGDLQGLAMQHRGAKPIVVGVPATGCRYDPKKDLFLRQAGEELFEDKAEISSREK